MYEVARIEDFRVNAAGTELKLFIPKANYLEYLTAKRVHSCGIWIEDGRHITPETVTNRMPNMSMGWLSP